MAIAPVFALTLTLLPLSIGSIGPIGLPHATPVFSQQAKPGAGLGRDDLEELVAPIALYPDPLLANVLAASVYPEEIKAAGAFVAGRAVSEADLAGKGWEPSVVSVALVPEVLKMMNDFGEWTEALGSAYLTQGPDLMAAVQALRTRAWDNGALRSTPQQVVARESNTIVIQPADPQVIYVPRYDPQVVYVPQPDPGAAAAAGLIGFGFGLMVGAIIADVDCDWYGGSVCWGGYHHWHGGNDVDIDVNVNRNDFDLNVGNRPRPGGEGERWEPNRNKVRDATRDGSAAAGWKASGTRTPAAGRVPTRAGPAAAPRPAAKPVTALPQSRPSVPAKIPSARPNRPSGFDVAAGSTNWQNRGDRSLGSAGAKPSRAAAAKPAMKAAPRPAARPGGGGRRR